MTDSVYPVPGEWAAKAQVDANRYSELYRDSIEDPDETPTASAAE